jgi:hypothetical protein
VSLQPSSVISEERLFDLAKSARLGFDFSVLAGIYIKRDELLAWREAAARYRNGRALGCRTRRTHPHSVHTSADGKAHEHAVAPAFRLTALWWHSSRTSPRVSERPASAVAERHWRAGRGGIMADRGTS